MEKIKIQLDKILTRLQKTHPNYHELLEMIEGIVKDRNEALEALKHCAALSIDPELGMSTDVVETPPEPEKPAPKKPPTKRKKATK